MEVFNDGVGRKFVGFSLAQLVAIAAPFFAGVPATWSLAAVVVLAVAYMAANVAEKAIEAWREKNYVTNEPTDAHV